VHDGASSATPPPPPAPAASTPPPPDPVAVVQTTDDAPDAPDTHDEMGARDHDRDGVRTRTMADGEIVVDARDDHHVN